MDSTAISNLNFNWKRGNSHCGVSVDYDGSLTVSKKIGKLNNVETDVHQQMECYWAKVIDNCGRKSIEQTTAVPLAFGEFG